MNIKLNLEQLLNEILNAKTLEEAKVYARVIKKGIQIDYVEAKFTKRPNQFIVMIKKIRDYTGWGLKEAKEFVEGRTETRLEKGLFETLRKEALADGGELKDVTPNSLKFIVED